MNQSLVNSLEWTFKYSKEGIIDYTGFPFSDNPLVQSWDFENFESVRPVLQYMQRNKHIPLIVSFIYIITAFLVDRWMKSRPALELKWPLVFWNLAVGCFSIVGFLRTFPDFVQVLFQNGGFYKSICLP